MINISGQYNVTFDFCAGCLSLLILASILLRNRLHSARARIFTTMVLVLCVAAFTEFATGVLRNTGHTGGFAAELITAISHLSYVSVEFVLAMYFLQLTGRVHGLSRARRMLLGGPEIIYICCLALPWIRAEMFYYDEAGIYHRGDLYSIYVLVVAFYAAYCLVLLLCYHKAIRHDFVYAIGLYAGYLLGMLSELESPYLRASLFIESLFVAGCTLLLGGEGEAMDLGTGVFSYYTLTKDIRTLFGARYSTHVIAVKLRHYNYYNVNLGVDTTENILRMIAAWLDTKSKENIRVYRAGNSEFAVLYYNSSEESAKALAEEIRQRFDDPWVCSRMSISVPAQVWLTRVPDKVQTEGQLAIFITAKYNYRIPVDQVYMADEMKDEERRIAVELAIQRALERETFEVYYQPIYDTKAGIIHSAEALIRLKDPELGMISPEEFIPAAEKNGTIGRIGEFVFESVCRFLSEGTAVQYGLEYVEVNLSTVQCMDKELGRRLSEIAAKYDVSPSRINLEITETAMIYSEETMTQVMRDLSCRGFTFALDDFGTGHANYSYILKFPFRLIKVDKSFLWSLPERPENRIIFDNMLQLIRGLKRSIVVEGIETREQRDMLTEMGVDYLQGYYYSKPVPEELFLDFLRRYNTKNPCITTESTLSC